MQSGKTGEGDNFQTETIGLQYEIVLHDKDILSSLLSAVPGLLSILRYFPGCIAADKGVVLLLMALA